MQFIDLKKQYSHLKKEIDANIQNVLDSGQYMMGDFVKQLEHELAEYAGVKYCIACANGTDALSLALMALDIKKGDAVFVPSFTFYATAEVVSLIGATPIFVDVNEKTFNMDPSSLKQMIEFVLDETEFVPKAIIAVDLFGLPADYEQISAIASHYNLAIIEDAAQGFGGAIHSKKACSFGTISTTSFFPAKPLGCYGDGGALFTDDEKLYQILTSLQIHGKGSFKYDNVRVGMNSRLDTIQAAILLPKLKAFKEYEFNSRNDIANIYTENLKRYVDTPAVPVGFESSWAQYTILLKNEEERNYVIDELKKKDIPSMVYYPTPLHKQVVYQNYNFHVDKLDNSVLLSQRCLSLPMHPYLNDKEQKYIIESLIDIISVVKNEEK